MRFLGVCALACSVAAMPALAQEAKTDGKKDDSVFGLGEIIIVTAKKLPDSKIGSDTLSADAIYSFNRNTLDDAANLMPGVSASNSGGSRNERLILVRGFNRFQVPLSIDGIQVYLPADNRLDFGRFLTPDISELQIAKGYASVLDGPGGMGGAINLVTRKPTKPLEAELRGTLGLDGSGSYNGYTVFGLIGTKQERWYAQGNFARNDRDHFSLSDEFKPTAIENGGRRDHSDTEDWRLNLKFGFTPKPGDEYSVSYTRQEGSKDAPYHVSDPITTQRYWSWPYWNIDSVYFLSTTQLGDRAYLKTRAYYNTFDNLLRSFDNPAQTKQTIGKAFNSYYADKAYGASAELGMDVTRLDTLRFSAHYRRDKHVEWQQAFPSGFTEPQQVSLEDTYSVALENTLQLLPKLNFVTGFGYDWRHLMRAEDFTGVGAAGAFVYYPLNDGSAWNAQAALRYALSQTDQLHLSVSSRTRFPTIFERFSSRFGGATSNPGLRSERATNYEIGAGETFGTFHVEGAVFYSRLNNAIVSEPFIYLGNAVTQSQNVGSGKFYGVELSVDAEISTTLSVGGNFTFVHRDIRDPANPAFRPTDVPSDKGIIYADWRPLRGLTVSPSVEMSSDQWTVTTNGALYYRTGANVRTNLRIDYAANDRIDFSVGARNMFDNNYQLVDGFPEEGRSFFLTTRLRY